MADKKLFRTALKEWSCRQYPAGCLEHIPARMRNEITGVLECDKMIDNSDGECRLAGDGQGYVAIVCDLREVFFGRKVMRHFFAVLAFLFFVHLPATAGEEGRPEQTGKKENAAQSEDARTGLFEWEDEATGIIGWAYVPSDYKSKDRMNLIVVNHGVQSDGKGIANTWKSELEKAGMGGDWVVLSPTHLPVKETKPGFVTKLSQEDAKKFCTGVTNTLKKFINLYNVNPLRIVLSGFSGGGTTIRCIMELSPGYYKYVYTTSLSYLTEFPDKIYKVPACITWGEKDHALILAQAPRMYRDFETGKKNIGDTHLEKHVIPEGKHNLSTLKIAETFGDWWKRIQPEWEKKLVKDEEKIKTENEKACVTIVKKLEALKGKVKRDLVGAAALCGEIADMLYPTDAAKALADEIVQEIDAEYDSTVKKYLEQADKKLFKAALRELERYRKKWSKAPYLLSRLGKDIARIEKMQEDAK